MEAPAEPIVAARGLRKSFGGVEAVRGIDFAIRRGEVFGFLGPNGAGKTSTMRMVACMSARTGGELRVLGRDPDEEGSTIRAEIGLVPQEDALDSELSVHDNLLIYGRYFDLPRREIRSRAAALLAFAQLTDRAETKVDELSGGMRRRLTIARALISHPRLLILDEPTTGLDPQARHLVWERLYELKRSGVTLVLTSHYMEEAEQLCDRLVVMHEGRIVAEGSPRSLIEATVPREVVELRLDGVEAEGVLKGLGDLAKHTERIGDRVLVFGDDGDALLAAVLSGGDHLASALVRRSTLEDVFLTLTGRELVD